MDVLKSRGEYDEALKVLELILRDGDRSKVSLSKSNAFKIELQRIQVNLLKDELVSSNSICLNCNKILS